MIIQHSAIPASDSDLQKDEPYIFEIEGYPHYRFRMLGLSLVSYYDTDKVLRMAVFKELYPEYSKEQLKKAIEKSSQTLQGIKQVDDLLTIVYENIIPVPLIATLRFILKYNRKFWRYPRKWLWNLKKFLQMTIDGRDMPELADRFLMYTVDIKKKLETILNGTTGSSMNMKEDSETSTQSSKQELEPVFLSASSQIFGPPKGSRTSKKPAPVV